MASAFKGYEPKGILVKSKLGKVDVVAELTKAGDFTFDAKVEGSCRGVDYQVKAKSKNMDNCDVDAAFSYKRNFEFQGVGIASKTKVDVCYEGVQDLNLRRPLPKKFVVSGSLDTDFSSTTISYKPGKKQEIVMSNNLSYKYRNLDLNLKLPTVNFMDMKEAKDLSRDIELSVSALTRNGKCGLKADNWGKNLQLFVESSWCKFLKGRTTMKVDIPARCVKSAFERELVVCKYCAVASRISLENIKPVKREYGLVLQNLEKNLKIRAMFDSLGSRRVSIDHDVTKDFALHMVGTVEPEAREAKRVFAVGMSFDA